MKKILSTILVAVILLSAIYSNGMSAVTAANGILVGDEIEFGSYPQSAIKDEDGNVTGYSKDPIKWRVLKVEDGKALLLSSEILDLQAYHNTASIVGGYYPNNYARSTVRQWLINDFYNEAFSNIEQDVILTTTLDNSAAPTDIGASGSYTQYSSVSTNDKVFLLSKDEANSYASKYFNASATDYAYSKGYATTSGAGNAKGAIWLLRTAGNNITQIYYVHMRWGEMVTYFNWSGEGVLWQMGVRPAMCIDLKAYDEMVNGKLLEGYVFGRDRYSFPNLNQTIDKKFYQGIFGELKGNELFEIYEDGNDHGHCFGMAYSLDSILNNKPHVTDFSNVNSIVELNENTYNNAINLTVSDYIKYCYVYQYSSSVSSMRHNKSHSGIDNVYKAAYSSVYNGSQPIVIDLWNIDESGNWTDGHTVYAIGIDGTDILVQDSNYAGTPLTLSRIKISNGSWSYEPPNCKYSSDKNSNINFVYTDDSIYSMIYNGAADRIPTKDKLITISNGLTIKNNNIRKINSTAKANNNINQECFWIDAGEVIKIENNGSRYEVISVTDDKLSIESVITKNSSAEVDMDKKSLNLETPKNITLAFTFTTTDEKNNSVKLEVEGITSSSSVTATQTESGIVVTGISHGTVTLSKNDEVIATQEIVCSDGTTNIIYDKNGKNADLELDYDEEHTYTSVVTAPTCTEQGYTTYNCDCGDTYKDDYTEVIEHKDENKDNLCDYDCGFNFDPAINCKCACHKNKFIHIIYSFIDMIFSIFGADFDCDCGKSHF